MQSTNLEEIKAALWEQASHQCTKVRFGEAQVMAVRCRKEQLLALCRGWGRWCAVEEVTGDQAARQAQLAHATSQTQQEKRNLHPDLVYPEMRLSM